jgi:type IV pilus assembly protein PilX
MMNRLHSHHTTSRDQQRGVALFIALIVMVAMSLAGVALIRSVDTTTSVVGNIAFRQASLMAANWAIEQASASLYTSDAANGTPTIADTTTDNPAQNYYAVLQDYAPSPKPESTAALNPNVPPGIPAALQKKSAFPFVPYIDGSKNEVRFVIERLCRQPGGAQAAYCDMMPPKQGQGVTIGTPGFKIPTVAIFRVSVRVDGPSNTGTSFVQAWLH